jgi:hypothetical protein
MAKAVAAFLAKVWASIAQAAAYLAIYQAGKSHQKSGDQERAIKAGIESNRVRRDLRDATSDELRDELRERGELRD